MPFNTEVYALGNGQATTSHAELINKESSNQINERLSKEYPREESDRPCEVFKSKRKPHGHLPEIRDERDSFPSSQEIRDNAGTSKTGTSRSKRSYLFEWKPCGHSGRIGCEQGQDSNLLRDNEFGDRRVNREQEKYLPRRDTHNKDKGLEAGCKPSKRSSEVVDKVERGVVHREASL